MSVMHHPNPKLLVYIAMADAYAAACEYIRLPKDQSTLDQALQFKGYGSHPRHKDRPGTYTDDTEMSAANARVLLMEKPFLPLDFATAYVDEFNRGGRRKGYSKGFRAFLESVRDGEAFMAKIHPNSTKGGAAMRSVPIGVLPWTTDVTEIATLQARITHDTPEGRFSARAVALMAHFAMYDEARLETLPRYLDQHLPAEDKRFSGSYHNVWPTGQPVVGTIYKPVSLATVQAAMTAIVRHASLMEILKWVLECGGDTDTVAAIAWGIASCRYQKEILPEFFERDLEGGNPETGAAYLRDLGDELMMLYGPMTSW
jgi:ADP-ribosylglycohydrolase